MVGSIESRELLGESALATLHLYLFNAVNVSHLIRHQQAGRSSRIWLRMGQTVRILATQPLAPALQRCHVPRVQAYQSRRVVWTELVHALVQGPAHRAQGHAEESASRVCLGCKQ